MARQVDCLKTAPSSHEEPADVATIAEAVSQSEHPFAVIMKPTDQCNLTCGYCYVADHRRATRMSEQVLQAAMAMLSQMLGRRRRIHFIWHGGEPLVMPLSFFEAALVQQERYFPGWTVENCVQTNGTLLTRDNVRFFVDHGFSISLSIDGPQDLHDRNRTFANGRGSYERVMRAVSLLREAGQVVGAVAVMTPETVKSVDRLYRMMSDERINFRINPVIELPSNCDAPSRHVVSSEDYANAMIALFDLWFDDDVELHVDPFNLIVGNMISDTVWGCDYHGGCLRDVICIDPDGGLYPCGQLAGRAEFRLGSVLTDNVDTVFRAPMFGCLLGRRMRGIAACGGCRHQPICNGGCPVSACMEGDILGPDRFCRGRQRLFDHIRSRLELEVRRAAPVIPPSSQAGGNSSGTTGRVA
jgi:uncharacterized protein